MGGGDALNARGAAERVGQRVGQRGWQPASVVSRRRGSVDADGWLPIAPGQCLLQLGGHLQQRVFPTVSGNQLRAVYAGLS